MMLIPNSWGSLQEENPCHTPPGSEKGGQFCSRPGASPGPASGASPRKAQQEAHQILNQVLGGPKADPKVRKRANIDKLLKVSTDDLHRLAGAFRSLRDLATGWEKVSHDGALKRVEEEIQRRR